MSTFYGVHGSDFPDFMAFFPRRFRRLCCGLSPQSVDTMASPAEPSWDKHRRELTFGGVLVKRFRRAALVQIAILEEFESRGWPQSIADPLGGGAKKLHNALFKLNGHQGPARIRFELNGAGRIIWTVVENDPGQENSGESDG